jgi:hypothetical protein
MTQYHRRQVIHKGHWYKVRHKDILVGEYFVDLLLNLGKPRLEIKRVAHSL